MHRPLEPRARTFPRTLAAAALLLVFLAGLATGARHDEGHAGATPAARPVMVFVHGLGGSPDDWLELANALGRDHRTVFVRLPGHTHAPMVDSLPLEAAAASLARTLRALDAPAIVIAHSAGGAVAVRAALQAPDRVAGLVLVESALRPLASRAEQRALLDSLDANFGGTIRAAYADFARDSLQAAVLADEACALGPRAFHAWLAAVMADDVTALASRLRVPVLAVLAPRSWLPGERWSAVADTLGYRGIARLTAVRIDSCGHFVMLDRPRELERCVRAWESGVVVQGPVAAGMRPAGR